MIALNHDNVDEMAAAYALHSMEPDERREYEIHLESCDQCRQAVAEFSDITSLLTLNAEPASPPPELKSRILSNIRASSPATAPVPVDTQPEGQGSKLRAAFSSVRGLRLWATTATAVAVAAVIALAVIVNRQQAQLSREQTIAYLTTAPQSEAIAIKSGSMQARVFIIPSSTKMYLTVKGMPALPRNRDYQVWLLGVGQPESIGVVHPDGQGGWLMNARKPLKQYQAIGITREPKGGSPRPTTKPIIAYKF